ncbi:MAG: sulfatase-like hydrolase/transferase, partial [Vicinamibacterales bacterium]|nr:sulfatase-like hydrolase/transferase [Vicinamibacterales bacterium]
SAGPFRGLKTMVYEGGIRVPMVARWTGKIPAGTVSAHASAFDDYMPTFAEMAGLERPAGIDGMSMLAALQGRASGQKPRDYLYWEFQGKQVVRLGSWKGIRNAATGAFERAHRLAAVPPRQALAGSDPGLTPPPATTAGGIRARCGRRPRRR